MELEKRVVLFLFLSALLLVTCVSALDLTVSKNETIPIVISELQNPAIFNLSINNLGTSEQVEMYSLVGVSFEPKGKFLLPAGTSNLMVKAYLDDAARANDGVYAFDYEIKGTSGAFKDRLTIKVVKLKDVFEITPLSVRYGDSNIIIKVRNVQNIELKDVKVKLKSVFFEGEKTLSFSPFEGFDVTLPVKSESVKDLAAGPYIVTSNLELGNTTIKLENIVKYLEKENIAMEKTGRGWIIRTTTIKKTNEGNLAVPDRIEVTKNILTRLFTSFSVVPLSTERKGLFVHYMWEKELNPGESWSIDVRTNYTLPFVLLVLIAFSAVAVYLYSKTAVVVRKRCSFVRTRGGEFALKVILHVKARKSVDNIEIFDRIPRATKLYEKAGMPHKFDERIGCLSWKIDRLNAGEERVFSYIIYSTIRIVGRLELSPATARFVQDGKSTYVHSNRTYFVSDIHLRF